MKISKTLILLVTCGALAAAAAGCGGRPSGAANNAGGGNAATGSGNVAVAPGTPSALPDSAFKAQITVADAPTKLRAGQKETISVKVKNASDVQWYARGAETNLSPDNKFYLAVGNRWLDANEALVSDMDGRYGLPRDLKPGEEEEVPLLITAPKSAGDYILELDLVQEQVAWFHDKGSTTTKVKIKVER